MFSSHILIHALNGHRGGISKQTNDHQWVKYLYLSLAPRSWLELPPTDALCRNVLSKCPLASGPWTESQACSTAFPYPKLKTGEAEFPPQLAFGAVLAWWLLCWGKVCLWNIRDRGRMVAGPWPSYPGQFPKTLKHESTTYCVCSHSTLLFPLILQHKQDKQLQLPFDIWINWET